VQAWREYLVANGKLPTLASLTQSQNASRDTRPQIVEDATLGQFEALSNRLPQIITAALEFEGVRVPTDRLDNLTFGIWLRLAAQQQATAERQGIAGILSFEGDGDGCDYPRAIRAIAGKVS